MKVVGSKITRKICALLVVLTIMSINIIPAYAATVKFTDITSHWARPYVEKLTAAKITTGVEVKNGVGRYAPEAPVKRVEVIAMLVRLLGLEEEAKGMDLPANFPQASSVPIWAKGVVAMAIKQGIIPADEDFRASEDALREDVAIFTVKAVGFGSEAESKTTVNTKVLDFVDAHNISLKARPYVEVAVEKGIMAGIGENKFDPKGKFTRGQMAKLIDNALQYKPLNHQAVGEVDSVESDLLKAVTLKLSDGTLKRFSVDSDAGIYKRVQNNNLERIALNQIKTGDKVMVLPDDNPNLTYFVEVLDPAADIPQSQGNQIKGTISDINSLLRRITLSKSNGVDEDFVIPTGAGIYFDGVAGTFQDLTVGQPVTLTLSQGVVTRIDAPRVEKAKTIDGILQFVSTSMISIENDDTGRTESYNIGTSVKCIRDDRNATLSDLVVGDIVEITVTGSTVNRIEAWSALRDVSGHIVSINLAPRYPIITVETSKGRTEDFEFSRNVSITKNRDRYADVEDLKKGDEVALKLEYDRVVSIVATSVKTNVSGHIKSITWERDSTTVTITDDSGEDYTFFITRDTDLREGRRRFDPADLRVGYYLDVEMENEEALEIQVSVEQVLQSFEGVIRTINTNREILIIEVGKDTRDVYYNSDTVFIKGKDTTTIKRIAEGDRVIVVGEYVDGVFEATSITVLNVN